MNNIDLEAHDWVNIPLVEPQDWKELEGKDPKGVQVS